MALIKNGAFAEDSWTHIADDETLDQNTHAIVSLSRWNEERESLKARNAPLGLRLEAGESPEAVAEDLSSFHLIELNFPAFKDGRAYSYARMLRQEFGFEGELRASGDVLRSQLQFMHRVGFDAFEVDERITPDVLKTELSRFTHRYQPSSDGVPTVLDQRLDT